LKKYLLNKDLYSTITVKEKAFGVHVLILLVTCLTEQQGEMSLTNLLNILQF